MTVDIDYRNQVAIFDRRQFALPVHIIGMGSIGTALFEDLCRLGIDQIDIWDADRVEAHNLPSQRLYRKNDVGRPKVLAAADWLKRQEFDTIVNTHEAFVDEHTKLEGVVFCAVDSIASRQVIWRRVRHNFLVNYFIDGRIGGKQFQMLACKPNLPDHIENYEGWLFNPGEARQLEYGTRNVIFVPTALVGFMVNQFVQFTKDQPGHNVITLHMDSMIFHPWTWKTGLAVLSG